MFPGILVLASVGLCLPAFATVKITAFKPSRPSPEFIGSTITWKVTATDTNPGPLTFQFNIAPPGGAFALVKDFNVGKLKSGVWTAQTFSWALTGIEGTYKVQVVIKDFVSGESVSKTVSFKVNALASGSTPVVLATSHPLVALFSAPSCSAGSMMRVSFQPTSLSIPASATNWVNCHPPATMTFEIAGMYANTSYQLFSQTNTAGTIVNGPPVTFTTGTPPSTINFATFTPVVPSGPNTDTADSMLLITVDGLGHNPPPTEAADLNGNIMWYYGKTSTTNLIRRPLPGGTFLSTEDGLAWTKGTKQLLRQFDLEGNIIRETNMGVLQQELLGLGYPDAGPCNVFGAPAPVGSACIGSFHHDAIQTLPDGDLAVLVDIEKIFPPGTQGDTSGLPVDVLGEGIVVLNANWQAIWFMDSFDHAGGAPELDINRPAVLNETCTINQGGCLTMFLLGPGIAPQAYDWLHADSLYYSSVDGDFIWSLKDQDWIVKVDYAGGTGDILWRLGPGGDFAFNNISGDPWPWNSHQYEVAVENGGAGPMTMIDNGNTRISLPSGPGSSTGGTPGLGSNCGPADCNSRGMALMVDEVNLIVTPVLSADLGVFASSDGSAQLLSNGSYYFLAGQVFIGPGSVSSSIEILPNPGAVTGSVVLNIQTNESYRGWRIPDLYDPPTT